MSDPPARAEASADPGDAHGHEGQGERPAETAAPKASAAGRPDGAEAGADVAPAQGEDRLERARRLLGEAMRKPSSVQATPKPLPRNLKVDKYFGDRLPPVCAQLGCYITDDGKRFYCVNPACQKHKRRETKHTRRGNPVKPRIVYFRCPKCDSSSIEMHLLSNRYVCRACKYNWTR